MNELLGLIRSIGVARLGAIVGITMGVAIALALIIARIGEPPLTLLYSGMELRDAQAVIDRLDQDGVKYSARERNGKIAILAPQRDAARLKMQLAADGVVHVGGVGYEIFDGQDAFGSTSFQQNINRLRALEGELARTITSINGVRSARVHLVLPERELFARDKKSASASIVVDAPTGLDQRSVRAIINLAASAVPELTTSRVAVLDAAGELLASGQDESSASSNAIDERTAATEARIRRTVEDLVGRIVGAENLRVQVAADLDFNRVTENAEIIDPDSQTVLSSVTVEESSDASDPASRQGVTIANTLPGAQTVTQDGQSTTSASRRTEETTNYEISRTVRSEIREQGVIRRLSVAVAINTWQADVTENSPRDTDDITQLEALVKSAIGFDEARGDTVEIVQIAFQPLDGEALAAERAPASVLSNEQIMRAGEVAALGVIALALVFFVLRPMLASNKSSTANQIGHSPPSAESVLPEQAANAATALPAPDRGFEQKIDLARVEGQVKASSLNKVSEVVKGHTSESIGILKDWIRQAS